MSDRLSLIQAALARHPDDDDSAIRLAERLIALAEGAPQSPAAEVEEVRAAHPSGPDAHGGDGAEESAGPGRAPALTAGRVPDGTITDRVETALREIARPEGVRLSEVAVAAGIERLSARNALYRLRSRGLARHRGDSGRAKWWPASKAADEAPAAEPSAAPPERTSPQGEAVLELLVDRADGMTADDIAAVIGTTPGTISVLLNRLKASGHVRWQASRWLLAAEEEPEVVDELLRPPPIPAAPKPAVGSTEPPRPAPRLIAMPERSDEYTRELAERQSPRTEARKTGGQRVRACLTCSKPFRSEGPHNRMCDFCRRTHSEVA